MTTQPNNLPDVLPALSIRQPWAWLILHAGKDVENRTWRTSYRGPLLLHAGAWDDGETPAWLRRAFNVDIPDGTVLERGGVVGLAYLVDCVRSSASQWFEGPWGWVLRDPQPLPFFPLKGKLGLFRVSWKKETEEHTA